MAQCTPPLWTTCYRPSWTLYPSIKRCLCSQTSQRECSNLRETSETVKRFWSMRGVSRTIAGSMNGSSGKSSGAFEQDWATFRTMLCVGFGTHIGRLRSETDSSLRGCHWKLSLAHALSKRFVQPASSALTRNDPGCTRQN
jgi:hypothetical protein